MLAAIRTSIAEAVRTAAREKLGVELESVVLERPPRLELGDLASPVAFDLAKSLRKPPRAIAIDLDAALARPIGVARTRVEGAGYLNFSLDRGAFVRALLQESRREAPRAGKIVVEHTNINPNKT